MDDWIISWAFIALLLVIFYGLIMPIVTFSARSRVKQLERQLSLLQQHVADNRRVPISEPAAVTAQSSRVIARKKARAPIPIPIPVPESVPLAATDHHSWHAAPVQPEQTVVQDNANPLNSLVAWALHGNPIAKLGVLLLFLGLAYLLKFSIERDLIPIEWRLMAAGILCLVLLTIGWRLRHTQTLYGLILQGGGVGALYITVFGAFRLYALLPHSLAFALMLVICAASVVLAVLQGAQSLAVMASLGGYLAPLLLSTGEGNFIGLFSYYALLSLGILAISLKYSWRPLNLIGFLFTFGIGWLWGSKNYQPELYVACQLFLLLNVLIFGVLAVVATLRSQARGEVFVDGTLVFGTPLLGFGIQYGITQAWEFGPAYSALGFALFYLPVAYWLSRRWKGEARLLIMSFMVLGGGFATLAIPLALSAQWTSVAWSLEGLGILWVGLSQGHRRMSLSGSALILFALFSALVASTKMSNSAFYLVWVIVVLTLLGASWLWRQHQQQGDGLARLQNYTFWGLGILMWNWLIIGGVVRALHISQASYRWEQAQWVHVTAWISILLALSTLIWYEVGGRILWRQLRYSALLLWPLGGVLILLHILQADGHNPWRTGSGSVSLVMLLAGALWLLWRERQGRLAGRQQLLLHISWFWCLLLLIGCEVIWLMNRLPWGMAGWRVAIASGTLCAVVGLMALLDARNLWPLNRHRHSYWLWGLLPLLPGVMVILVLANRLDARMMNWLYLPLLNPLEESALLVLMTLVFWYRRVRQLNQGVTTPMMARGFQIVFWLIIGCAVWWANGILLRLLAAYGELTWSSYTLWHSRLVQTTFAIVWALSALISMVVATRYRTRTGWIAGAALLCVVIVKLFAIDSVDSGGLARALAFLGVAGVVLVIGYLAPLPPKKMN